jgi:hypothetical protein
MENDSFLNFWGNDWIAFGFIVFIIALAGAWRVFDKAGKPGWTVIIPIYNILVLLEIVGKPWWWLLLMIFVPLGSLIWGIWTLNLLSISFGKNAWFTVGLYFLSPIFWPILGFGNAEYKGPAGKADEVVV